MSIKRFLSLFILCVVVIGINPSLSQAQLEPTSYNSTLAPESESVTETKELQFEEPQQEMMEAVVEKIITEEEIVPPGATEPQLYQELELLITSGSLQGKRVTVEHGDVAMVDDVQYQVNDNVLLVVAEDHKGEAVYHITDYIRRDTLLLLFLIFIVCIILTAKWRGVFSLLGMSFSFLVIFFFVLQQIYAGSNAILIAILGSLIIVPVTFFLSHGFGKKTAVAIAGTLIALVITVFLANSFISVTRLTGYTSDEAGFLQVVKQGSMNMTGLLLAGVIIGALGVLDDVTISQSAVVFQLKKANPQLKFKELYHRAMDVGQDHIASMVNTLLLVYTGASLPLLLLFIDSPIPFSQVVNNEIIAEEIVRTLVGSIGLVLAVPITTFIAVLIAKAD